MPDIKLGPQGSETTLPAINWEGGGSYGLPVGLSRNVEKASMIDGGARVNIKTKHQRTFELEWALLNASDVLVLRGLANLNQPLRYQDNRLDSTWRWVWISSFDVSSVEATQVATPLYSVSMSLEERT